MKVLSSKRLSEKPIDKQNIICFLEMCLYYCQHHGYDMEEIGTLLSAKNFNPLITNKIKVMRADYKISNPTSVKKLKFD